MFPSLKMSDIFHTEHSFSRVLEDFSLTLNISANSLSNQTTKVNFEISSSLGFWNCPWLLDLIKIWLRYWGLNTKYFQWPYKNEKLIFPNFFKSYFFWPENTLSRCGLPPQLIFFDFWGAHWVKNCQKPQKMVKKGLNRYSKHPKLVS